jgi:putative nucleotidyltransferase with HDIG domain
MLSLRSARGRAILASAVLVVLLASMAVLAVWRAHDDQQRHHTLQRTSAAASTLEGVRAQFYHQLAYLSPLVFSDDPTLLDEYLQAATAVEQSLSRARAEALAGGDANDVLALDDLTERIANFSDALNEGVPLLLEGDLEMRVQLATDTMSEVRAESDAIASDLDEMVGKKQQDLAASRAAADRAAGTTLWLLVGFGTAAFLVATGTVAMLIVSVVRPLARLRASARAITAGDSEARARVSGPEEIVSLARDFNEMTDSLPTSRQEPSVPDAPAELDLCTIAAVGAAAEIKDPHIRRHQERVSHGAAALAEEMGLSPDRVRDIRIAGLLHDIGKVSVSEQILNKPGKLTRREFDSIKEHPIVGATLVSQVKGFEGLVPIVRHHHERFDGKGYPHGLARHEIPLEARILTVADVFDAMTHERSYRKALTRAEAIAELERGAGTQFDPAVVRAFLTLLKRQGEQPAAPAKAAVKDRPLTTAKAGAHRKE